ncbi:sugar-binding domain-containing protein [Streptomyces bottropensis]|uniref:sugar-binding domain-containing protein n=1 Tax=Streptomyces bottropensis TaxID=42235 RepID=UPI00369B1737
MTGQGHSPLASRASPLADSRTAASPPVHASQAACVSRQGTHRGHDRTPEDSRAARELLGGEGEPVRSCARVWLNGVELGVTRGSRPAAESDVTHALRPGPQRLGRPVHHFSSGTSLEDQRTWLLAGIFRDAVPARPALGARDGLLRSNLWSRRG